MSCQKSGSAADRKNVVAYLGRAYQVSVSRACKTTGITKSVFYYRSVKDDTEVVEKLNALVESKPTRGFPYYFRRLRNEGHQWNHKWVKRVYNLLALNLRRKSKRRLPQCVMEPLCQPAKTNDTWSMDFMHDSLVGGRKVRVLNIIDDYNRQALCGDADYSHSGQTVVWAIERNIEERGKPKEIRCDNGPEFISYALVDSCNRTGIHLRYIQPGKPTQNAYVERFNRSFREDVLDAYLFESLNKLRDIAWNWMYDTTTFIHINP